MAYLATTATQKLTRLRNRIRGVSGGTSAGKTISILQLLIDESQSDTTPGLTSVVSESFPHLNKGAIRDFLSIMKEHGYFKEKYWNKTEHLYTFETGSQIEFFSADMPSKVHGPRRKRLFINEANNIPYETYDQLTVRTSEYIWMDWNPTHEFWFYTEVLPRRADVDFIKLTYKDNEGLEPSIVQDIESHRDNKNWWAVYGMGELGEVEGKIYTGWITIDDVPHEARLERYGLDFGYSSDPAAIVAVYYYNGGYILDEVLYQKGLVNKQLADVIINQPKAITVADSAEPKSIDDIRLHGLAIIPAIKGPGSLNRGIDLVRASRISVTKRSTNLLKEYRNYMWKTATDGSITTIPDVGFDHTMDAVRYAISSIRIKDEVPKPEPTREEKIRAQFQDNVQIASEDEVLGDFY